MTERFETIDEILDFAIARETEAHDFYEELAAKMDRIEMKKVLREFAIEELGHRMKLEAVKAGEVTIGKESEPPSLQIAEYVADVEPSADMSYLDALVVAMKREKAAYRLYMDLAASALAEELTDMFLALAAEEAKHKLRFELEYEEQRGES